jgi:hypothetical protein
MRSRRAIMKVSAWRHHDGACRPVVSLSGVHVVCSICAVTSVNLKAPLALARLAGPGDARKPERPAAARGQPGRGLTASSTTSTQTVRFRGLRDLSPLPQT